jgi:hypothetical protein
MSRDWDKELAKIDKQLESISDDALLPATRAPAAPPAAPGGGAKAPARAAAAAPAGATPQQERVRTLGVALRLLLAAALAIAMPFWPYKATCGLDLAGYLAAVGVVVVAGGWSAVWSWRHRSARAHVAALVLVGWGLALAAAEVLPRAGYAKADPARALWVCE